MTVTSKQDSRQNGPSKEVAMDADTIRRKHTEYLFPCVANYYQEPLVLVEGKGLTVKDADGRSYLDFFGGILTVSLGHADDRVNAAVKRQIDRLIHVSTLYPTAPIVELAEKLAEITPGRLKKSFFTASGTEADETAVMMAQIYTGNIELIALRHGYSGRSILAQSLTGHANWRAVPTQIGSIKHAVSPYCYRCPLGLKYPSCQIKCASDLEELIQTTTTGRIAGFLAEPIQGVGGFITPPPEYFQIAVDIVRKYGGVFISDEVQTGFGRTGGRMFGIEHWGVEPDIMTMAKGIANGFPISATIATEPVADSLDKTSSIATFGGNPVCSTAAIATINVIVEENIPQHVERVGNFLRDGLVELQKRYPKNIGQVRGMGLMQALELVQDETAGDRNHHPALTLRLFEATKKRRLLIGKGGRFGNVVRLAPPMTAAQSDVEEALNILGDSFADIGAA